MPEPVPLYFEWTEDEVMRPLEPKRAARQFCVGMHYRLEVREDRSEASHRGYFAAINEAHANLPEDLAERWPTPEHLRKFCLIKAGYRSERSIACSSELEARRIAVFVAPLDSFAIVVVEKLMVTVYTAESQSYRSMGKKRFNESKSAVLDVLARLIGTSTETLRQNAGMAA